VERGCAHHCALPRRLCHAALSRMGVRDDIFSSMYLTICHAALSHLYGTTGQDQFGSMNKARLGYLF
jgi:hypothetical protein